MIATVVDRIDVCGMPDEIDEAYAREVNWAQGFRLNPDARLLLLGIDRLLKRTAKGNDLALSVDRNKTSTAVVLGSDFGSLFSYESFFDGIIQKKAQPLAYTHALPSTPTAAASIYFGFVGQTITLSGDAFVGISALQSAVLLLSLQRCDRVVAGCWHSPSDTTRGFGLPERANLLLLVLERAPASDGRHAQLGITRRSDTRECRTCVEVLDSWIEENAEQFVWFQ